MQQKIAWGAKIQTPTCDREEKKKKKQVEKRKLYWNDEGILFFKKNT